MTRTFSLLAERYPVMTGAFDVVLTAIAVAIFLTNRRKKLINHKKYKLELKTLKIFPIFAAIII
jgi:hypothetical protein